MPTEIYLDVIDGQYCILHNWPSNIDNLKIKQFFKILKGIYSQEMNGWIITYHYAIQFKKKIAQEFNIYYQISFRNIFDDYFWFNNADKNSYIKANILQNWQLQGLQKCSSNSMRFLLKHGQCQGKTLISLLIAKKFINQGGLLIIVASKILHLFWHIHVDKYYGKCIFKQIQNFQIDEDQYLFKVIIIDYQQMRLLQKLPSYLKNFIIIDDIHLVDEKNIEYTRQFSQALGLTRFPQKYTLLLLKFLCLKVPIEQINHRYKQKKHRYQEYCIIRSYYFNNNEVKKSLFKKKVYVEFRQKLQDNYKLEYILKNIDCKNSSCYNYFDIGLFRQIIFEFKQKKIRNYIQYCLKNIYVCRKFYFYSDFLEIAFNQMKKDKKLNKNIEYINLRKINKNNLLFNENFVHTFLQTPIEESILQKLDQNNKIEFFIAVNTSEEVILDKSLENVRKAKNRKSILKKNTLVIDKKQVRFY